MLLSRLETFALLFYLCSVFLYLFFLSRRFVCFMSIFYHVSLIVFVLYSIHLFVCFLTFDGYLRSYDGCVLVVLQCVVLVFREML